MTLEQPQLLTAEPSQRVALRGTHLDVLLAGGAQKAVLAQTFVNLEAVAIEAVYTFPLPAEAAVCGFEVITGERVLTGQVEEAEKALERYDTAISAGHGAFLLEENRPDVFTVNVGNLKPGQAVTVKISFVAPLLFHERRLRLAYPTTIAPRYVSASGQSDPVQAEVDGLTLNPPHVLCVPYGLSLAMDVRLGRPLRGVSSPTHALRFAASSPEGVAVALVAECVALDQDLVIEIDLAADAVPVAQAGDSPDGQGNFLAVTFLPEFESASTAPAPAQEIVFVLDCSGSMQGESITQAKRALELCLRSMNVGDRFSICRFGSTFEFMSAKVLGYSETTLGQALAYLGQSSADLGGTELHGALTAVLKKAPAAGTLCNVILLTDGQVSNEAALIRLAGTHRTTHRIFTFGIGSACSHYLVQGLATATRGAAEFVAPDERIEEKVLRTFSRIGSLQATEVSLEWGGARAQQAPAEMPPVFDGDPLTVYACIAGELPAAVTLSCQMGGQRREWRLPVARVTDAGLIALTWARARLGDLETGLPAAEPYARACRASPQERRDSRQLVALSKRFGVLCSRTSFIAVEHRSPAERNEGRPELRRVPVQLARGWHGITAVAAPPMACQGVLGESRAPLFVAEAQGRFHAMMRKALPRASRAERGAAAPLAPAPSAGLADSPCVDESGVPDASQIALELLSAQTAPGWFEWRPGFDAILAALPDGGHRLRAQLTAAFNLDARPDRAYLEDTLLVLWLLQSQCAAVADLWRRAATKAAGVAAPALGLKPRELQAALAALSPTG